MEMFFFLSFAITFMKMFLYCGIPTYYIDYIKVGNVQINFYYYNGSMVFRL